MRNNVFYSMYVFYSLDNRRKEDFIEQIDNADTLIIRAARKEEEGSGYGGERDISFGYKTLRGVTNAARRVGKVRIYGKRPRIEINKRDAATYDTIESWEV